MNRDEFERLRKLPNKTIEEDIIFKPLKGCGPNLVAEKIKVLNAFNIELLLNATYRPEIPSISLNFTISNVGPICRLEINASSHGDSGRNHKHELMKESCPRKNLPYAYKMDHLAQMKPQEIWTKLCELANIIHKGKFIIPGGDI